MTEKMDAFELARRTLTERYGSLDDRVMRAAGADEVELGAARNIREGLTQPEPYVSENQEPSYVLLVAALREAIGSVGLSVLRVQHESYRNQHSSRGLLARAIFDAGDPNYDPDVYPAVRSFLARGPRDERDVRHEKTLDNLTGAWVELRDRLNKKSPEGDENVAQ